jgi:signal transduction histidine kinase
MNSATATKEELAALGDFIAAQRNQIAKEWMETVRADPAIPSSDDLTHRQLADHLPALFDDLTDALRGGTARAARAQAKEDAESHGSHRWHQGYNVEELLREIVLIRHALLQACGKFLLESAAIRDAVIVSAERVIRKFFDDLVIESVAQYVSHQQREMQGINASLEQTNQHLAQTNQTLQQVDDSRLRLTRNVSHELRNIANALHGAVLLLSEDDDAALRREMIGVCQRSLQDMQQLLNQLLDYSALLAGAERLKLQRCSLADFCDNLTSTFRPLAQQHGLHFTATSTVTGEVHADYRKLKQIASNLIGNAFKYGKVNDGSQVLLTCADGAGDTWTLTVEDHGPGISPEHLQIIFNEFERGAAEADIQGTGLGLTITKSLIALHGGTIGVESTLGQGSRFRATFPRTPISSGDLPV